jgi:ATP dependent DNA ligase domain
MLQRTLPAGFIAPCLPTKTTKLPSGSQWLHEIKHDGFRIIARKDGDRVRLYSRPGNDMTRRFPLIAEALPRHQGAAGLARAQKHSAHGALHRAGAGQVQKLLARLGSRSP